MAITIGTADFPTLTAQPFGYEETDTRSGQTARKWSITGLLKPSEWLALLSVYDTWRDARIDDQPTLLTAVAGTTIAFSGAGPGGQTWTNVACWFATAPEGEQTGSYLSVSIELVDANQAVEVLLRGQENEDPIPSFGNWYISGGQLVPGGTGSNVITLISDPVTYQDAPTLTLSATGNHIIEGALSATKVRNIEGTTSSSGWTAIQVWYQDIVKSLPGPGIWFPVAAPTAQAEIIVSGGVRSTRYTVSLSVAQVK